MPTRHAKPHGEAERGAPPADSRPEWCTAAPAQTSTDNDWELATDVMDTDDQDIETEVSSVADAEYYSLSPAEGLVVKELQTDKFARAIERASGDPETSKRDKFLLRLRNSSHIFISSSAYEVVAEEILKFTALELNCTKPVNIYISTPAGYLKGVVSRLERGTPEDELFSHLGVQSQGATIVQARMLGKSQTAVITFDGPIVPQFVYYYDETSTACEQRKITAPVPWRPALTRLYPRPVTWKRRGSRGVTLLTCALDLWWVKATWPQQ
ncbi:hypothetical protein HPB50_024897 [Hyalomma asiaticum]|uniref:Uncharacterized protein n=1 Tax=Hyalomma asiaticum TaxID=266040 RepID=A0ACB7TMV8_HYAAI|nr:hypothetical protein HPB50_024897 [Hyalomma asiaticum]